MESETKLKVLLVDDCSLTVEDFKEFLHVNRPSIQLLSAATEKGALIKAAYTVPDIVITDLHLESGSGFQVVKAMKALRPSPVVIVLTNFALPRYRDLARLNGADYFVDKSRGFSEVVKLIDAVARDRRRRTNDQEDTVPQYLGGDVFAPRSYSTDVH